ncbi:hypothetical protein IV203_007618 [Nitzschia inconspicua]|uniref:Uncharacterized protein n=1 Tax=Nitzschia inconspicua TaxID=303405 RepID=A0A9K3KG54_9STRA|nr:hypothetical protein IV203_007618 [Nitzschia inconspicua]
MLKIWRLLNCYKRRNAGWESLPSAGRGDDYPEFVARGQEALEVILRQDLGGTVDIPDERANSVTVFTSKSNKQHKKEKKLCKDDRGVKMSCLTQLKRSLERRMHDGRGSFSANMVTYSTRKSEIYQKPTVGSRIPNGSRRINSTGQIFFSSTSVDDRSRCSASTRSLHTMHVIDEELEYI